MNPHDADLLRSAADRAVAYLAGLADRPVGATADARRLAELMGGPLPVRATPAADTLALLDDVVAEGGTVATSGGSYFGFVVGGTLPVAVATDWLVSAWDQNAGVFELSPAAAMAEQVAGQWLVDLFGLPAGTSVGFTTGCAMAHLTALAAARHHVLAEVGWDVERDGLPSAPRVNLVVGEQRHLTVDLALRYLGFGTASVRVVPAHESGEMNVQALRDVLAGLRGPTIVCAQAGDVHTGAVDPVGEICGIAHQHGAWVHVDGAFGLWAAASPTLRHLVAGVELADSWASDAHKWLNVPYDCGLVFVARPEAHRGAMLSQRAGYLPTAADQKRDNIEWVPDFSRRARGLPVWAALRSLGRVGVADLVDRCCAMARRFAERLAGVPDVEVLNDVVLNQVMVRFADDDQVTEDVIARLQATGTCWFGGTTWAGRTAMRISVSSWRTGEAEVDSAVEEISAAVADVRAGARVS